MDAVISVPLMKLIEDRANAEKEVVFYSRTGDVTYTPINEKYLLFKSGRRQNRRELEIKRLVICDKTAVQSTKPGSQYFTPLAKKRKKAKYHRVVFSCQTIYELADRYGIEY